MITKRMKRVEGKSDLLPEGIYGVTSTSKRSKSQSSAVVKPPKSNKQPKARPSKVLKVKQKTKPSDKQGRRNVRLNTEKVMPDLEIDYSNLGLPAEATDLNIRNVVEIKESLLKDINRITGARTKNLSRVLLKAVTPTLLSYDAAMSYVKTVLGSGFKLEVDTDTSLLEIVKDITRLEVVSFYVKRLSLKEELKDEYLKTIIAKLIDHSMVQMDRVEKSNHLSSRVRDLEGVLVRNYSDRKLPKEGSPIGEADSIESAREARLRSQPGRATSRRRKSNV